MEQHIFCFILLNIILIPLGYWVVRNGWIITSWIVFISGIYVTCLIFADENAILRMLALIGIAFSGMKIITTTEGYKGKVLTLPFINWTLFFVGWFGMRAQIFETLGGKPLVGTWPKIKSGLISIFSGVILIALAHILTLSPLRPDLLYIPIAAILLIAFSLILHFGILSINAGVWRFFGVATYSLFRSPLKSKSLNEFWSKRWNLAFSEMTSVAVFRPLRDKNGNSFALILAFLFSGLLHELAISIPVKAGLGLPFLYFVIQGLLVIIEKELIKNGFVFLQNAVTARLWTFLCLVVPVPLLFHKEFIESIILPVAGGL